MNGYDQIKENRSLSPWGMNGSIFKNETLFVSFTAIITTRNGWNGTNFNVRNRVVRWPCYTVQFFVQLVSQWWFVRCCSCKVRGVTHWNAFVHFSIKASRLLQRACVRSRCYGNIARKIAERVLHDAMPKKIVAIVAESRTRFYVVCNLSWNDFDHCTACYTVQLSVQLVSRRRCEASCMKNCAL